MRQGVRIGVDVGSVRVGISRCDNDAILAVPVETIERVPDGSDLNRVVDIVHKSEAIEIIVGLPTLMSGKRGGATKSARRYARRLASTCDNIPVRLVDERLTTVEAHRKLRDSGKSLRTHKSIIDQAAAVLILDNALAYERQSGMAPGEIALPLHHKGGSAANG